ncbi:MAG: DUF485 domain-containing protein [Planctomycetaceae bacterium]|nr:DUF485 domain-containing protein [Planctomycetaceae bacterium]
MASFGHGSASPAEVEDPVASRRNARNGLKLFAIYFTFYCGFVGLNAFWPDAMTTDIAGINLAVWYGLGLIVAAFGLALVYMALCRGPVGTPTAGKGAAE